MGTWPAPEKNFFCSQPLMPGVLKYSAFATNVTRRGIVSGMNSQSLYDRWLHARMAAPSSGRCSSPSTRGRKTSLSTGPSRTSFSTQ